MLYYPPTEQKFCITTVAMYRYHSAIGCAAGRTAGRPVSWSRGQPKTGVLHRSPWHWHSRWWPTGGTCNHTSILQEQVTSKCNRNCKLLYFVNTAARRYIRTEEKWYNFNDSTLIVTSQNLSKIVISVYLFRKLLQKVSAIDRLSQI